MMNRYLLSILVFLCLSHISFAKNTPFRILHVMSYHHSWVWNIDQFEGFKDALGDLEVEYKIVELDTKRISDPEQIRKKADNAKALIESWKPHLLYTNDDNAQKYVAQDYVNTSLPIVFSGVNRDPSEYNFMGSKNVTGVMEHEHIIPSLNLLYAMTNNIRRVAVIIDNDPTWIGVISRMRSALKTIPEVHSSEFILVNTLKEYKQTIKDLQDKADVIALLGVFNIKDEEGIDVDYEKILKWTAQHSQVPDFAFWESRVDRGTLGAVAVSGYEQGFLAGEMAKKILISNRSPSNIAMRPSDKGQPMLSLARAKDLGLALDVKLLLETTVKKHYAWDR